MATGTTGTGLEQATSEELAFRTGLQERYLREWLGGMAAAGYLTYHPATTRYGLPSDHQPVLAEESGPLSFDGAFFDFSTNFGGGFRRLLEAFRVGGGVSQQELGAALAESIEKFTAPWLRTCWSPSGCRPCPTSMPSSRPERRSATSGAEGDVAC